MLAILLAATKGGSGFGVPPAGGEDELRIVAFLTRLSNYVLDDDEVFPFDQQVVLDTNYFTWGGTPGDPLVCVDESWYWIGGNFTLLGTDYGGAASSDFLIALCKNGQTLADFVAVEMGGRNAGNGAAVKGLGLVPVYLAVGDELTAILQNLVAGQTTMLVESNPTDGLPGGYLADTGPGTLSPHIYIAKGSGPAPTWT